MASPAFVLGAKLSRFVRRDHPVNACNDIVWQEDYYCWFERRVPGPAVPHFQTPSSNLNPRCASALRFPPTSEDTLSDRLTVVFSPLQFMADRNTTL